VELGYNFSLANPVVFEVVEQSSASGMALYSTCQYPIHNVELSHGCYAILIVYHTMPCSCISYALYMVIPDVLSKDIGSLCHWACLSTLLVHPKGGRSGGTRVVTSYTGVVPGYVGSLGYDHAPRCCRGRRQVVTALSVHYGGIAVVSVVPHVRVWCRSSERCNGTGCTPVRDILPDILSLSSEPKPCILCNPCLYE
jgi:hypothetical protein